MDAKHNLVVAAAISTILATHGAAPPRACIGEKLACPEPEKPLSDMLEYGHRNAPSLYGSQTVVMGTGTGAGDGPAIRAANAIRQIMATPAQFPRAYEQTFEQPWRGNLLITTPPAQLT
jgi:hypothetical protein